MPKKKSEREALCLCCAHYELDEEVCKQCSQNSHWLSPEDDWEVGESEDEEEYCYMTAKENDWNERVKDRTLAD